MIEPKRKWCLVFINAYDERTTLTGTTITARGQLKSAKKMMRLLDRRRGLMKLISIHPDNFALEIVQ